MKAAVTLLALVLAACATATDPDPGTGTGTVQDKETLIVPRLLGVTTSCQWVPDGTCYGQANDGANIWPADREITSTQVLMRAGPDRLEHKMTTFLAFVVWNGNTVGRIFRVDNDSDANDFRANLNRVMLVRTVGFLDHSGASTGSPVAGPVNPPHPNVEGPIEFESTYLDTVRRTAFTINDVTANFLGTRALGVD